MGSPRRLKVLVPEGIIPDRLDRYLAAHDEVPLTRSRIQHLIDDGRVLVDGRPVPSRHRLTGGETIEIDIPPPPPPRAVPEPIPLDVVYEDEFLLVVNKPPGMVTHPAAGNYSGTLVNALLHRLGSLPDSDAPERPGIVHRLDKGTSGLILVARDSEVFPLLQAAMQRREIQRTYLALVCGHLARDEGVIATEIGRSRRNRKKMVVTRSRGRRAITEYAVRRRFRSYDLLEVRLQTGRTHQVRVHMAHLGHPVFGDPEYGGRETWVRGMFAPERPLARELLRLLDRQALHAWRLAFIHPRTGQRLEFTCPPPPDMQAVLDRLEKEGS